MKIIHSGAELILPPTYSYLLTMIELAGRSCYKSEDKITDDSAETFVKSLIARGHEAVLEHASLTVRFTCDRGVSHEIVRHRLAAYCQESTRYCNYSKGKFGSEITVIEPSQLDRRSVAYKAWEIACSMAEGAYLDMLDAGCTPQEARAVLPNSLKTEVVMTANLREWRHFFRLRCAQAAHPDMRAITIPLLRKCKTRYPVFFADIEAAGKEAE